MSSSAPGRGGTPEINRTSGEDHANPEAISGYVPAMAEPGVSSAPDAGVKGEVRFQEPTRSERTIARRSAESRATVPDVELRCDVEPHPSVQSAGFVATASLVRACAISLREVPRANAAYRDGRFELYSRINIGVTVTTEDTYAIPTVFGCDRKSTAELSEEIARVTGRAGSGELSSPELTGATFTVSNVGELGLASSTPVIVPPQAAALSAGAIRAIGVARDGGIVPGHAMTLTLACDHRILYGAQAAAFLIKIKSRLEEATL